MPIAITMLHIVILCINRLLFTSLSPSPLSSLLSWPTSLYLPPHYFEKLWSLSDGAGGENLSAHHSYHQPQMKSSFAHHSYHQPSMKSNFAHHSERNVGRRKLSTVSQGIWALFRKSIPHQLIQIPGRSWLIPQISFLLQAALLFSRPMKVFFGALKHRTRSPFLRELPKLFGSIAVEQILSTRNFYLRTTKTGDKPRQMCK